MIFGSTPPTTPKILKVLLIINVAVFVLDVLSNGHYLSHYFGLNTFTATHSFELWRIFSYMFLHDINGVFHILFNMLMLWIFGLTMISEIGEKKFLNLYLSAGFFAGVCTVLYSLALSRYSHVVGASGAIFAVLVVYAMYYPNRELLIWGLFPVKAKWLVAFLIGIDLLFLNRDTYTAHITHLGGALYGFLYFRFFQSGNFFGFLGEKKFQGFKMPTEKWKSKDVDMEVDIDPILEKISKQGMESLTKQEKKILEKASKNKKKNRDNIIDIENYRKRQQ